MAVTTAARDGLEVVTNRGGKGRTIIQRGALRSAQPEPVEVHLNKREQRLSARR